MIKSPLIDLGFDVLVFSLGDDPIACLNKAMAFLTDVAFSMFLSTNNQLRTSLNLRNQATIQDDRVTVKQIQGRQGQSYSDTGYKSNATSSGRTMQADRQGLLNATTVKEAGQILDVEKLAFLVDLRVPNGQAVQTIILDNAAFQTEDLDMNEYRSSDNESNSIGNDADADIGPSHDSNTASECLYIMSTEMPPSVYILLTMYEAIIVMMKTGSDDGMKVSHGMLRDETCDQRDLLWFLEELERLIDERVLKYGELRMKEKEVQALKEIEKRLKEREIQQQESLVTKGTTLEACLVTKGAAFFHFEWPMYTTDKSRDDFQKYTGKYTQIFKDIMIRDIDAIENGTELKNISSETIFSRSKNENRSYDRESSSSMNDADAYIRPSYDSDIVTEMVVAAQNTNNTTIRCEKKMKFVEQPTRPAPDPKTADPKTIDKYYETVNLEKEVACLMLPSMSLDLHRTLEKYNAYDMLKELKTMFKEQAKQKLFETVKAFHTCKQEEG
nr:hypothetical protein [Tanacetum cinerariifolium]